MKKTNLFLTLTIALVSTLPTLKAGLVEPEAASAPAQPVVPAHITDISQILHRFDPATNQLDLSLTLITQIDGTVFTQIAQHPQLQNLQTLWLGITGLGHLPSEIGSLVNLQRLYLFDTQLKQIPSEIGNLVNLQKLVLHNTQLAQLPPEIDNLRNLQELWLNDTPLSRRDDWQYIRDRLQAQLPNTRIYPG